jgi:hypothetical protein
MLSAVLRCPVRYRIKCCAEDTVSIREVCIEERVRGHEMRFQGLRMSTIAMYVGTGLGWGEGKTPAFHLHSQRYLFHSSASCRPAVRCNTHTPAVTVYW